MKTSFLFLDESYSSQTKITSLTGLIVPIDQYSNLRNEFYTKLIEILYKEKDFINLNLPELHASELLNDFPGADDDLRFQVFDLAADLVISNDIHIIRIGYEITESAKLKIKEFTQDNKEHTEMIYSAIFAYIIMFLQPRLEDEYIIPVMDGFNSPIVNEFSRFIKNMDAMRWAGWDLSIKHSENILGEVFYADSQFAIFTQLVDLISYLRLAVDLSRKGFELSEFKKELFQISTKLQSGNLTEEIRRMEIN